MCFTSFSQVGKKKEKIYGKWYYKSNDTYTTVKKETHSFSRWYDFKNKSKVIFSTCTDICGCMRTDFYGKWKWENDSTIVISYERSKRLDGDTYLLKKPRQEKLSVLRLSSNTLKIERAKEE